MATSFHTIRGRMDPERQERIRKRTEALLAELADAHRCRRARMAVLSLPTGDRSRLARRLIESLDQDLEIEAAWEKEIARRVAKVESGDATLLAATDVFSEARRLIDAS